MSEKPAAAPEKAKGSKSKLMMIVAGVLLVAGAGGGYFWYTKRAAAAAAAEEAADADDDSQDDEEAAVHAGHGEDGDHAAPAKKKAKKKKKKKGHDEEAHARLMTFEPFVVNLADPGAARFLRTNVQLVVSGGAEGEGGGHGEGGKGPSVEDMRARSAILELLSAETSDKLTTPEGKDALKEQIMERIQDVLEKSEIEVEDVLFSDFVIQF
jgi:flagellar FliL protein